MLWKALTLMGLLSSLLTSGCALAQGAVGYRGGTPEQASTQVADLGDDLTIRTYPKRLVAEASVPTADEDDAFNHLFKYITGANEGSNKIAMTAPVEMTEERDGQKIAMTAPVEMSENATTTTMRFFLPAEYTMESAPRPTNPVVSLRELPEETFAVIRFSGRLGDKNVAKHRQELEERLALTDWVIDGEARELGYDPPWTPGPLRRNELIVPVRQGS